MRCLNCSLDGLPLSTVTCPQCGVHLPSLLQNCLKPGTMLHHNSYHLDYPIGSGGFGITYRAFDIHLCRPIAIKEFFPREHTLRDRETGHLVIPENKQQAFKKGLTRFLTEGTLLAQLDHPSIVKVYTSFQENNTAYLVMELLPGKTLRDELRAQVNHVFPFDRIQAIMAALVDALSIIHQRQIYHLDLAPDNIMLTQDQRVILIDFGASRQGLGTETTQAFKEAYAPPELIAGKTASAVSDIFELGMMLQEMVTGTLPPSAIARCFSQAKDGDDLWRPQSVPEPWQHLVGSALRLKPEERPANVWDWWSSTSFTGNQRTGNQRTGNQVTENQVTRNQITRNQVTENQIEEPTHPLKMAGFALRFMAYQIDFTLLLCASFILHIVFGSAEPNATDAYFLGQLLSFYIMLALVYGPVMESSPQQATIGKQLMSIVVSDRRGQRITLAKAYKRHIYKLFSYLTCLVGFILAGSTREKQALHDIFANTLVIRRA